MLSKFFDFDPLDSKLDEWLKQLIGPEVFSLDNEGRLERHFASYKKLFENLNIPIVIVGGTNGKGETSLFLEMLCLQNGLDCFLWSSPHILSVRERFSTNGRPINGQDLLELFEKFEQSTKELSYYEFLFKCFCEFVSLELDRGRKAIIILEVGLGGRLDATNFFDSSISALTSIGRDHTAILGNTLEKILNEKIEITRSGTPLVSAISQKHLKLLVQKYCETHRVTFFDCDEEIDSSIDFHQRNLALAQRVFSIVWADTLGIKNDAKLSIEGSVWARPLRVTYKGCQFILLGSHNLDGLRHLARWAYSESQKSDLNAHTFDEACFGFSRHIESELIQCLRIIGKSRCLGHKRKVFAFTHQRATSMELLERAFSQLGENELTGLALEQCFKNYFHDLKEGQTILVSGSYYFLSFFLASMPNRSSIVFN